MHFHVIGIGNKEAFLRPELQSLVDRHRLFSGGQRHYELVKHLLPIGHRWIFIKSPMEEVFAAYKEAEEPVLIFATGDPLFYGFSNTLKAKYPEAVIYNYPWFSSIQLLAHKAGINYSGLHTVSVHGRGWEAFDEAIIRQPGLMGMLTDKEKSPSAIARRLREYGYTNYSMVVGEDLEGGQEEILELSLEEASGRVFYPLNCLILRKESQRPIPFGIPDHLFKGLEGRPNMITKMPVRLCSLHALDLAAKKVLWDIGYCTGSLSIEAKLRFPHLTIHAFEKREECQAIIAENQRRFGVPGIHLHQGDFFETDLENITPPDAVFVGGHGGRLTELLEILDSRLLTGGVVLINAVQDSSIQDFTGTSQRLLWKQEEPLTLKVNSHNRITVLKAIKVK